MAISKILHMKDSGNSFHARHLKRVLDYVMNPEKTQRGRLVGAVNCQADMAFEQMMDTKKQFGKTDKRQGYHIILSFKEDEVEPDRAFEITQKFVAEYLGDTTMFLPEQLVTINEEQIIQTAGMIVSTDAIKKVDAMLIRQLQIGEYDG